MHRVVQRMRGGTPLPRYPLGGLPVMRRIVKAQGGHIETHCPVHGWVRGEYCPECRAAGHG